MFKFLRKTFLWILLSPVALSLLGAASNQAVLMANHDTFPVMVNSLKAEMMVTEMKNEAEEKEINVPEGMIDDVHCLMTSKTHLNFLADVFDLKDGIYSIGDFGIMLGSWLWGFVPYVWGFAVINSLKKE